jgi:phosphoribosylaminoimidazole-succinocarboxamide synthase
MTTVYSGKSKTLSSSEHRGAYYMTFKDEMRAADGRYFPMKEKGVTLAEISSSLFTYLSKVGVPNHFIKMVDERTFLVKKLQMLPLEFVVRRFAEGSYLKRNPEVERGQRFNNPVFEVFYKDDSLDDPFIAVKNEQVGVLHQQKLPISKETIIREIPINKYDIGQAREKSIDTFLQLEKLFSKSNAVLCDLKLEFGIDGEGNIILADSIEPDSWRLRQNNINLDRNDGYEKDFDSDVISKIKEKYKLARNFIQSLDFA